MSSFVGHGLVAVGLVALNDNEKQSTSSRLQWLWWGWLLGLTWLPDIDYLLLFLREDGLRRTHSFSFCLIAPLLTILVLTQFNLPSATFRLYCFQAMLAGLSHICLDILVGVTGHPLFYPFDKSMYGLTFGILPSAGYLHPANPLFWRNMLIELGVWSPILVYLHFFRRRNQPLPMILRIGLGLVSLSFIYWAYSLPRL